MVILWKLFVCIYVYFFFLLFLWRSFGRRGKNLNFIFAHFYIFDWSLKRICTVNSWFDRLNFTYLQFWFRTKTCIINISDIQWVLYTLRFKSQTSASILDWIILLISHTKVLFQEYLTTELYLNLFEINIIKW